MSELIKKISTSALAKVRGVYSKELFRELEAAGLILRAGDKWQLTDAGKEHGGEEKVSPRYGNYIVWPETLPVEGVAIQSTTQETNNAKLLTVSAKMVELSAQRVNYFISTLQKALGICVCG